MRPRQVWKDVYLIGGPEITLPDDCLIYLIDGGDVLFMVDCGLGQSAPQLISNISALALNPRNLKFVLATHAHIDHIGGLSFLHREHGVEVIAHKADASRIESGTGVGAEFYGVRYEPCPVTIRLEDDLDLALGKHRLSIIHIPGHTPGSLALYLDINGKRILFAQDVHGPYLPAWGADPRRAKDSLKRLLELKADILCEGHFGILEPADRVERYIRAYLDQLVGGELWT